MAPLGAYGFRIHGLSGVERWLVPQLAGAPGLTLALEPGPLPGRALAVDLRRAEIPLSEGVHLSAAADSDVVTFTAPGGVDSDALIHPFLAPAAALHWTWRGRETLHAGAVLFPAGAVLLLGTNRAGKSTLLAALARAGHVILADDMVVVGEDMTMPAGPRSIDRRRDRDRAGEAELLTAESSEIVRDGTRQRLRLGPAPEPDVFPIRAWIELGWGEAHDLEPITTVDERLRALAGARRVRRLVANPQSVLDLAALPAHRLLRPPGLGELAESVRRLESAFAERPTTSVSGRPR